MHASIWSLPPSFFQTHFKGFACDFLRTVEMLAGGIWIKYIQFQSTQFT